MRALPPSLQGGPSLNFAFEQLCEKLSPRMDPELVMGLVRELNSFFLLSFQEPGIRTPGFGNYLLGLTHLGQHFVSFIEGGLSSALTVHWRGRLLGMLTREGWHGLRLEIGGESRFGMIHLRRWMRSQPVGSCETHTAPATSFPKPCNRALPLRRGCGGSPLLPCFAWSAMPSIVWTGGARLQ